MRRATRNAKAKCYDYRQQRQNTAHLVPARCLSELECVKIDDNTYIARIASDSNFVPSWLDSKATVWSQFQEHEHYVNNNLTEVAADDDSTNASRILMARARKMANKLSSIYDALPNHCKLIWLDWPSTTNTLKL